METYRNHVSRHYGVATIIFDGYAVSSIKDLEHLRRTKRSSVTVTFTPNSPLLVGKEALLSNKENKQLFLKMLGDYLEAAGHTIFYAESDADTLIVRTALTLAERKHVTVVADDTDIYTITKETQLCNLPLALVKQGTLNRCNMQ